MAWANRLASAGAIKHLVATKPSGAKPTFKVFDDEQKEAAAVAAAAKRAIAEGTPPSEVAVLYRFNAAQARFEAAFARAGVPAVVADDVTFFERDEIRAVLVPFGQMARTGPNGRGSNYWPISREEPGSTPTARRLELALSVPAGRRNRRSGTSWRRYLAPAR